MLPCLQQCTEHQRGLKVDRLQRELVARGLNSGLVYSVKLQPEYSHYRGIYQSTEVEGTDLRKNSVTRERLIVGRFCHIYSGNDFVAVEESHQKNLPLSGIQQLGLT